MQKRKFKLKDHNFKLTLVEGDIVQLSPYLYSNDAAIAVRDNLKNRIISRCSWLKNQATTLQSGKNWNFNPIKKLIWSGKDATPNLTQKLIEQYIKQPNMIIHSKMKSFECRRIITISNGKGNLKELMSSCQDLYY